MDQKFENDAGWRRKRDENFETFCDEFQFRHFQLIATETFLIILLIRSSRELTATAYDVTVIRSSKNLDRSFAVI